MNDLVIANEPTAALAVHSGEGPRSAPADSYLSTKQVRAVPACLRFYRLPAPLDDVLLRQAVAAAILPSTAPKLAALKGFQAFLPPEELPRRALDHFFLDAAGYRCLRFMTAERKIAPPTLKRAIAQRKAEFAKLVGRPPQGRENRVIESEVTGRLLLLSPVVEVEALLILDPSRTRLALEARTPKAADSLVDGLRQVLGSFPCEPVRPAMGVDQALTVWLSEHQCPPRYSYGGKVSLRDSCKQAAALSNHDLGSSEVLEHIAAGKLVQQVEFLYEPVFSFSVNQEASFLSIRPLQPEDKRPPLSTDECIAIGSRVWPAIFEAASTFFRALVQTQRETQPAERPVPLLAPPASTPALAHIP